MWLWNIITADIPSFASFPWHRTLLTAVVPQSAIFGGPTSPLHHCVPPSAPNDGERQAWWVREVKTPRRTWDGGCQGSTWCMQAPCKSGSARGSWRTAPSWRIVDGAVSAVMTDAAAQIVGTLWFMAACPNSIWHLCIRCHPKKGWRSTPGAVLLLEHSGSSAPRHGGIT